MASSSDPLEGNWNLERLALEVLQSRERCISWCQTVQLLPSSRKCPKNGKHFLKLRDTSQKYRSAHTCVGKRWVCDKHRVERTIAEKTWFEYHNVPMEDVLRLTYYFSRGFKYTDVFNEVKSLGRLNIAQETVADIYSYCREVCMLTIERVITYDGLIGGPGKIIEIDEMKFGRRKYGSGRVVEGQWIFGALDIETKEFRLEICPINKRNRDTLISIIKKHIAPGSTIYSDCWRAHDCLQDEGCEHLTVNQSINFVDSSSGANTQAMKNQWRQLRFRLQKRGVRANNIDYHLCEYIWRKQIQKKKLDPFTELIRSIRIVYPGIQS